MMLKKEGLCMKKTISLVLGLLLCLSLCACGGSDTPMETTLAAVPQGTVSVDIAPPGEITEPTEPAPQIEVVEVPICSTLTTDFVEMTFREVIIAQDIKYSVRTGNVTRTTGPEPLAGQQYICLTGTIKNLSTSELPVYDFFIGNFSLDGYNYSADANSCDILDGEWQPESMIAPLMEYTFRIYAAIPDSLANSHSSCEFNFGFFDLFDNYQLSYNRSFEEDPISLCPYQFVVPVK